ncbi:MAG: hypothetical protein FWD94_03720 [Treponema sp.]|nr:hypothetical protein [Treponema sp.]
MRKIREPSLATRILALAIGIAFFYSGCSFGPGDPPKPGDQDGSGIPQLAGSINDALSPEVLDLLETIIGNNPDLDPEIVGMLNLLLTDPQGALELIAKEENGAAILAFYSVIFNEGTTGEALAALEALDPDAAAAFAEFLDAIAAAMDMVNKPVGVVH